MKPIRFALSLAVVLPILVVTAPAHADFSDVPPSHEYYKAITYVEGQRIVNGYSDGTFRPDQTINRAEFTKIMMGILSRDPEVSKWLISIPDCLQDLKQVWASPIYGAFSDVDYFSWYGGYVCQAQHHVIIHGDPGRTFRPADTINVVEAAKILNNFYDLPISEEVRQKIESEGGYWYTYALNSLSWNNIFPLDTLAQIYAGNLDYRITRGEIAEMMYRIKFRGSSFYGATSSESSVSVKTSVSSGYSSSSISSYKSSSSRSSSSSKVSSSSAVSAWNTSGNIDVSVGLTGSVTQPEASKIVFYQATLTNHGPADMAQAVFIRFTNSGNMVFLPQQSDASCIGETNGDVSCAIAALGSGDHDSVIVKYQSNLMDCGDTNHVVAILDDVPPNDTNAMNNNSDSWTTTAGCQ